MTFFIPYTLAPTFLAIFFKDELKELLSPCYTTIYNLFFNYIVIDNKSNPKTIYAIKQELLKKHPSNLLARDGPVGPIYDITDGNYEIIYQDKAGKEHSIYISISEEKVKLKMSILSNYRWTQLLMGFIDNTKGRAKTSEDMIAALKQFLENIYNVHCSPEKAILFFLSNEKSWEFPIFRRPRNIPSDKISPTMKSILEDVENFRTDPKFYEDNGYAYRRGYFLYGKPGSGKSTLIEIIARKYNMDIYMVNFNIKNMSDAILIKLVSNVPLNSIIVFEEIEKQIEAIEKDSKNTLSFGGILTAIDGPQRLAHGNLVIMTANDIRKIDTNFMTALCRKGRIDCQFELN